MDNNLENNTSSTIEWKAEKIECSLENIQSILPEALLIESVQKVEILIKKLYTKYKDPEEEQKQKFNHDKLENDKGLKNQNFKKCREIVKFLLLQEINLNFPNSRYSLLLHFVMMHGDEKTFRFLLQEDDNFDLHSLGPENQTILHYAVYENKKDFIKHLIDFGIDINIGDHENKTALHYAVRKNNSKMINYLLSLGADVNKKMKESGYTALHIAVVVGNEEIINILLESGADIKAKCESGQIIGQPRCKINHQSSMLNFVCGKTVLRKQLLFSGINFPSVFSMNYEYDRNRVKMIFNAKMIKFLLEKGAETEVYDFSYFENSATPLQRACEIGRFDIVELLLNYGADPYSQDCFERTMIFYAVLGNNYQIVDLFLRKNLDINARDKYGRTPLYNFIQENVTLINRNYKKSLRISMVDFLVDNGAEVNINCGTKNNTPLHCAAILENPHLIESLLNLKADYRIKDKKGIEPFVNGLLNHNWTSDICCLSESVKVFTAFIALTDQNLYDPEDYSQLDLKLKKSVDDLFNKCRLEVVKMKNMSISLKRNITFHQFLVNDLLKVLKYGRSRKIMQILESFEYKSHFPCYKFLLEKRVERVKELLFIQNYFKDFIEEYAKNNLPIVVIDKIFSYLSIGDLRNFGRAMCLLEREKYCIYIVKQ